jgi:hypothetical protein
VHAAEKKTALVVGVSSYDVPGWFLKNPRNDAESLAAALPNSGFQVFKEIDLDRKSLVQAVNKFSADSSDADIALFFFSGHGLQAYDQNYLVPKDARIQSEGDIEGATVSANYILKTITANRDGRISIVMLDACRNNPFAAEGKSRSLGLATQPVTGPGKYVVFSTDPGLVASDGQGMNSPFTKALLTHLGRTSRPITELVAAVRYDVVIETKFLQTPWDNSSLLPPIPQIGSGIASEAPPADHIVRELSAWHRIKSSKRPEDYLRYITEYPDGAFIQLANLKARALLASQSGRLAPEPIEHMRQKAGVLWVDDQPEGNVREVRGLVESMSKFLDLDVTLDQATGTASAVQKVREGRFDAIISDMGRTEDGVYDPRAGYKLLEHLRLAGVPTPFIVYSSSRNSEHLKEAERRGAHGSTNDPLEVIWHIARSLARR